MVNNTAPAGGRRRSSTLTRIASVALLGLGVVSACSPPASTTGSSSQSSNNNSTSKANPASLDRAKAAVTEMKAEPKYKGPTQPLDASKVRGKTVYFVAFDLSNAFNKQLLDNFREAAGVLGLRVVALSGQVNPALENTYVNQAVKAHAAGIVLLSIGHEEVPAALANAKAAGIPVITMAQRSAGFPPGENITNQVTASTYHIGEVQADLAYMMSNGYVNAVGYGGASLPQDVDQWNGQRHEIEQLCPGSCKYKSQNLNLSNFQTTLPNIARAALTADPKLNWFFPDWDILGTYVLSGIKAAGATNRVQFSSWNGIPAALQLVQSGQQAATFGVPLRWWGWAAADMISRYIAGQKVPAGGENLPVRLFTTDMVKQIGSTIDETKLYNDASVFGTYRKLWGAR